LLRALILNQSGQEVEDCSRCDGCDCQFSSQWDARPCDVLQLVRADDERVFSSKTVWACEACQECYFNCPSQIDFGAVAHVIRQEAKKRRIVPPD